MEQLQERIDRGEIIILDGATGTELDRRGVPMHGVAWSAWAPGPGGTRHTNTAPCG